MAKNNNCIFTVIALCLLALIVSGCQSAGAGRYVGRGEFNQLSERVDKLEERGGLRNSAPPQALLSGGKSGSAALTRSGLDHPEALASSCSDGASLSFAGGNKSEKAVYQQGQAFLKQKRYERAADVFRGMLVRNPVGLLAPNARYWLGECYYARGEYDKAATEFLRCSADYPDSPKASDALLKLSYSYDRLGDGPQAMNALDQLLSRYPGSEAVNTLKSDRGGFRS